MRRAFLFLLAMIVCIICSGSTFSQPPSPTDPVLSEAIVILPNGRITSLGGGYVLIRIPDAQPVIANLNDGSSTPVTFIGNPTYPDAQEMEQLVDTLGTAIRCTNSRYAYLDTGDAYLIIDRETATVTALPAGYKFVVLNPDGTMLIRQTDGDKCTLTFQTQDGDVLVKRTHSFGGYRVTDIFPLEDGYLLMLSSEIDSRLYVQWGYVILDRDLNAGSIFSLGSVYLGRSFTHACYEGIGGTILLHLYIGELLVLSQDQGPVGLISWTDTGLTVTPVESAEELSSLLSCASMNSIVEVSGISADKKYAILNAMSMERGLFKLDFPALSITEQMTHAELLSIDMKPLNNFIWDGSGYAVTINRIYRVVLR
ncbi:MAG: hypothetical protein IKK57_02095 [Clostridia bacterium]|nr:hypothetical protein [Clostridia bacterium]